MGFVLRPGERMIRYFHPEPDGLNYLPYKLTNNGWEEFPHEPAGYPVFTKDGPRSQKDSRRWATGAIEYRPPSPDGAAAVFEVRSPYVIIDAEFQMDLQLGSENDSVAMETSTDDGRTWLKAGHLQGVHTGAWQASPEELTRTAHGRRTAVSGRYGYLVRLTKTGGARINDLLLTTRFQLNPRTLPALKAGRNELIYTAGPWREQRTLFTEAARAGEVAEKVVNARYVSSGGQGYWAPLPGKTAEFVFRVFGRPGETLSGFRAGGRFLDLSSGRAPDKLTAEVRRVTPLPSEDAEASISWGACPDGPFREIWSYSPPAEWKDGDVIDRLLPWPEVDREVAVDGLEEVCVRYRTKGLAVDDFRLTVETTPNGGRSPLMVTHLWRENGAARSFTREIAPGDPRDRYAVETAGRRAN